MKVILWDWDNTLADTIDPLKNAFNATFRHYNMPTITREQMKIFMNSAGSQLFKDLFPGYDLNEVKQIYLKNYQENIFNLQLLPGAKEVLKWTKEQGFINILASNKHYLILRKEAELSGLAPYFNDIFGAEQFSENKPSKVFTDNALKNYSDFSRLFSVGDGLSDVKMAHNYIGGTAILVGTNPKTKEFLDNPPDFAVETLNKVPEILQQVS
ncbi:MAG: HAD family hydrolase [Alphaproteobacteria bacterium]